MPQWASQIVWINLIFVIQQVSLCGSKDFRPPEHLKGICMD